MKLWGEVRLGMELQSHGKLILVRPIGVTLPGIVHVLKRKTRTACGRRVDDAINILWRGQSALITCDSCVANLVAHELTKKDEEHDH